MNDEFELEPPPASLKSGQEPYKDSDSAQADISKRQSESNTKAKLHRQSSNKVKIKIKGRISTKPSMDIGSDGMDKEAMQAAEDKILNQIKKSQMKYQLKDRE